MPNEDPSRRTLELEALRLMAADYLESEGKTGVDVSFMVESYLEKAGIPPSPGHSPLSPHQQRWSPELLEAIRDRASAEMGWRYPPRSQEDRDERIVWAMVAGLADTAAAADRLAEALERVRDHGQTHDEPCYAIHNGDCAEKMQEIARSALSEYHSQKEPSDG